MKRLCCSILFTLLAFATVAGAQVPATAAPVTPRNLRFDITITEVGSQRPMIKTLTLMMTDKDAFGSLRNNGRLPPDPTARPVTVTDKDGKTSTTPATGMAVPLNIDVRDVAVLSNDQLRARINVEYQPYLPDTKPLPAAINGSAAMVFENGKKATILQTVDPISDRKTIVEVTATILK